ncbi:TPA: hypothetical protein LWK55_002682, partial [Listeria innocua]|nr:hypothetical protein [Listeria innocua]
MDRYDYIESVVSFLKGVTGINYQLQLKEILAVYYKYLGKVYEMPDFYGGDQKNDGCVLKDGLFYQVFAPTRLKDSLKKEIQDKFVEDLSGLLNIIYEEKKWNGRLNNFIFIVNTFDNNLPHDSEGFFEKKVNEFKEKYAITFQYRVTNTDYVRDILTEINDIEVLKRISATLRVRNMMDYNAINEQIIMDLIIGISGNLSCQSINGESTQSYQRISSVEKISINSLDGKRDEIESIISKLDVVENAVNTINQDILYEDKFERVKEQVISKYVELSAQVRGVELYNTLVNEMLSYSQDKWNLDVPMKFLI